MYPESNNEKIIRDWQIGFEQDYDIRFCKHSKFILRLYQLIPNRKLASFIAYVYYQMRKEDFRFQKNPDANYQNILKDILTDILDVIKVIDLYPSIKEINETSGFKAFNAESVPFFGDNYISINAGVCFHCHILARCIHTYFCEVNDELRMGKIVRASKRREFVKTCIALLSGNFTKGFSPISVLTDYGDLLHGMEVFIVAHELGHIVIHDTGYKSIPFYNNQLFFRENF